MTVRDGANEELSGRFCRRRGYYSVGSQQVSGVEHADAERAVDAMKEQRSSKHDPTLPLGRDEGAYG